MLTLVMGSCCACLHNRTKSRRVSTVKRWVGNWTTRRLVSWRTGQLAD